MDGVGIVALLGDREGGLEGAGEMTEDFTTHIWLCQGCNKLICRNDFPHSIGIMVPWEDVWYTVSLEVCGKCLQAFTNPNDATFQKQLRAHLHHRYEPPTPEACK
jgi:hypothetical protein